ncbi:NAD(P)-binding protein [Mycena alexandri]|uniref:NAD(P)-binding protein n=1 Tax=Mycena alexandri TaxID=1745969 RepID=A0AAD6WTM9_9AGAR|nr:NAD(P)-binding protein [Mycena alexandri]
MPITSSVAAPLVLVVGATGNQGGSVIQALAESGRPYRIRGLTRDVTKPAAQRLTNQGVEMVNVSLTVENEGGVKAAFTGANIAFIVTNFWEHMDTKREVAEGKMLVDAALGAGVQLLVWSGLEPVSEISKGKYHEASQFDGKAEITNYARQSGIDLLVVEAGWYGTNHMHNNVAFIPQKEADGSYALRLPVKADTVLPVIDVVRDYGLFVRKGIESPAFGAGTEVLASGEDISLGQMMSQLSQITGKHVSYKQISDEEFMAATKAPPRIALELLHMMKFYEEFGYFNGKDTKPSRQHLTREPKNWADFVRVNDWSSILV